MWIHVLHLASTRRDTRKTLVLKTLRRFVFDQRVIEDSITPWFDLSWHELNQ